MSFIQFIKSKSFFVNLGLGVLFVVIVVWGIFKYLDVFTNHGETITVPDLTGLTVSELETFLEDKELKYAVSDSIYNSKEPKGSILEQNPAPNTLVKSNRTIYVKINALGDETVKMPNLQDLSQRLAIDKITRSRLKLGKVIPKPSEYAGYILGWEVNGKQIDPGTPIKIGTVVNIMVGAGQTGELVAIPYLVNMTYDQANQTLGNMGLNVGAASFDSLTVFTSEDSAAARIFKQIPSPSAYNALNMGGVVNIWLTKDTSKVQFNKSLKDSLDKALQESKQPQTN